jgi:hypothetical protein
MSSSSTASNGPLRTSVTGAPSRRWSVAFSSGPAVDRRRSSAHAPPDSHIRVIERPFPRVSRRHGATRSVDGHVVSVDGHPASVDGHPRPLLDTLRPLMDTLRPLMDTPSAPPALEPFVFTDCSCLVSQHRQNRVAEGVTMKPARHPHEAGHHRRNQFGHRILNSRLAFCVPDR